jgi:hypothetical protein
MSTSKKKTPLAFLFTTIKNPAHPGRVSMLARLKSPFTRTCLNIPAELQQLLDKHVRGYKNSAIPALALLKLRELEAAGLELEITDPGE